MIQQSIVYQSLIPNSRLMRSGIILALLAIVLAMVMGVVWYGAILVWMLAAGIASSAKRYRDAELTRQIPGMSHAHTRAAIHLALCLWLVLILASIGAKGLLLYAAGFTLLAIGLGLVIGAGEIVFFYLACGTTLLVFSSELYSPGLKYEWRALPDWMSGVGAMALLFLGAGLIYRYWVFSTRRAEFVPAGTATDGSRFDRVDAMSNSNVNLFDDHLSSLPFFRAKKLLEAKVNYSLRDYIWLAGCVALIVGLIIFTRNIEGAILLFQFVVGLIAVILPATVFFARIQPAFERLWLIGSTENRLATVRRLIEFTVWNSLMFLFFSALALALHSSFDLLAVATAFSIMFCASGIGALLLLAGCTWHRFLINHQNMIIVLMCFAGLFLTVSALVVSNGKSDFVRSLVEGFGAINSLLVTLAFAVGSWTVCWMDGGSGVANDSLLLD